MRRRPRRSQRYAGRRREQERGAPRGEATVLGSFSDVAVTSRVHNDGHGWVVLRSSADHGWASDVDLLNATIEVSAGGNGLTEWVQVYNNQLESLDAQLLELREVIRLAGISQDSSVDLRVQRLHAAFEALWEAGELLHWGDVDAKVCDLGSGGTGGNNLNASCVEGTSKVLESGLVVDADQGALDLLTVIAHSAEKAFLKVLELNRNGFVGFLGNLGGTQDLNNELAFDHLDAFVQAGLIIVSADRYGFLRDDATGVYAGIDKVDGGTCDLHSVCQCVADAVGALEGWQQCWVGVDGATLKAGQEVCAQDLHETS